MTDKRYPILGRGETTSESVQHYTGGALKSQLGLLKKQEIYYCHNLIIFLTKSVILMIN